MDFISPLPLSKHWPNGQRTDVGICPYNISTAQNTEWTGYSLPFYGFEIPATFAQIPTWGGQIASCSTEMDVVQIEVNCAVICPMPDALLVGYTEGWGKG